MNKTDDALRSLDELLSDPDLSERLSNVLTQAYDVIESLSDEVDSLEDELDEANDTIKEYRDEEPDEAFAYDLYDAIVERRREDAVELLQKMFNLSFLSVRSHDRLFADRSKTDGKA